MNDVGKQPRVRAKHERPDGTPVVRVEVPAFFSLNEAALALAVVFADQPVRFGVNTVMEGLRTAAKDRVLESPAKTSKVPQAAVDAYRAKLIEMQIFPADKAGSEA